MLSLVPAAMATIVTLCGAVACDFSQFRNLEMQPRSFASGENFGGSVRLVLSGPVSVAGSAQRIPEKDKGADVGNRSGDRSTCSPQSPKSHILLGLEILVGCVLLVVGVEIFRYADANRLRWTIPALLGCGYAAVATILLGILLVTGIAFMYSCPPA